MEDRMASVPSTLPRSGRLAPPHGNRMVVARGAPILSILSLFGDFLAQARVAQNVAPILENFEKTVRTFSGKVHQNLAGSKVIGTVVLAFGTVWFRATRCWQPGQLKPFSGFR